MNKVVSKVMNKLTQSLMILGLNEKEASIYIALYKLGEATSYQIAKESGIKRPTVYVIMEELRRRGLVLVVPHEKKQLFIARDPHEFIQEHQNKTNEHVRNLLALLPKLSRPDTNTIVFKGEGALAQGLSYGLQGLKEKEVVAFYAAVGKGIKVGSEYSDHFNELHRLGFTLNSITPSNSYDVAFRDDDRKYGFETKKISHKMFSPGVSVEVSCDLTKIIIHKKREVIAIRDRGVADFHRQIFAMLWNK